MTPEERERLRRQITVITAPLPPAPLKALPAQAGESSEAPPVPSKAPRRQFTLSGRWRGMRLGLLAAIMCVALVGAGLVEGVAPTMLRFGGHLLGLVPAPPSPTPVPANPPDNLLARSPSISIVEVGRVLERVGSPILPYAGDVYAYGLQYGIDPVFALAFWMKESGIASDGSAAATYHNPGWTQGLATDPHCGRWACWPTWPEGIAGWFRYMRVFFIDRGIDTVEAILPIYAPSSDGNNTSGYITFVLHWVAVWRAESAAND